MVCYFLTPVIGELSLKMASDRLGSFGGVSHLFPHVQENTFFSTSFVSLPFIFSQYGLLQFIESILMVQKSNLRLQQEFPFWIHPIKKKFFLQNVCLYAALGEHYSNDVHQIPKTTFQLGKKAYMHKQVKKIKFNSFQLKKTT